MIVDAYSDRYMLSLVCKLLWIFYQEKCRY